MSTVPLPGYDQWLEAPATGREPGQQAEDAYDLYVDAFWQEQRAFYDDGCHDYDTWDDFQAAGDQPESFDDFFQRWYDREEEAAVERAWEQRYPDARI